MRSNGMRTRRRGAAAAVLAASLALVASGCASSGPGSSARGPAGTAADLPVFEANVQASMQVIDLLSPYLQARAASTVALIKQRHDAVETLLAKYKASTGYENTGYVDYSTVTKTDRKQLSAAVNALAEAMSKVSSEVSA